MPSCGSLRERALMQGVSTDNIDWDNLAAFFFNLLPHQHSAADIKRLTELSEATAHYSPMLRAAVEDFALASFWEQHTGKQFQCRYSVFALIYVVFILPLIHQHLTVHARSRPLLKQDTVHYACSRSQAMWWHALCTAAKYDSVQQLSAFPHNWTNAPGY